MCEQFIKDIVEKLPSNASDDETIDRFVYIRLCQVLGIVAVKHLDYLDETVYKELKRREHYRSVKGKKDTSKREKRRSKNKKNVGNSVISDKTAMDSTLMNSAVSIQAYFFTFTSNILIYSRILIT